MKEIVMKNNKKVVAFDREVYKDYDLDKLTDRQKWELALEDEVNVSIWDDLHSYNADFNDGLVSLEHFRIYVIDYIN